VVQGVFPNVHYGLILMFGNRGTFGHILMSNFHKQSDFQVRYLHKQSDFQVRYRLLIPKG
jgi:hypothetical protein